LLEGLSLLASDFQIVDEQLSGRVWDGNSNFYIQRGLSEEEEEEEDG